MLPSGEAATHLEAVREFGAVLDHFLPVHESASRFNQRATRVQDAGAQELADQLVQELHGLAGPATEAFAAVPMRIVYRPPPATGQPARVINPAQNWGTVFEPFPMFTVEELRGYVAQAEGALQARFDQAQGRERGIVGWLAKFVLLPRHVREVAGLAQDTGAGRLAFGVGVAAQMLIALLAGAGATVLGTLALRLLGWA